MPGVLIVDDFASIRLAVGELLSRASIDVCGEAEPFLARGGASYIEVRLGAMRDGFFLCTPGQETTIEVD